MSKRPSKNRRILSIASVAILTLFLPLIYLGVLFGLVGDNPEHYVIMAVGAVSAFIFSVLSVWRFIYYFGVIAAVIIFFYGAHLSGEFWRKHNADLCQKLRSDPSCEIEGSVYDCQNGIYSVNRCND